MADTIPNADIVLEADRLRGAAGEADVPVRLVGGLAVRAHLPAGTEPIIVREYKDIDLVTLKGRGRAVSAFMTEQGYEADRVFNTTNGHRRLLYYDVPHQRQVDVFVGSFEMCHSIPITERIAVHPTAVATDMIHNEPPITTKTIKSPKASANTLLVLSGPVVMCRKKTRCPPICAIASTMMATGMRGCQTRLVPAIKNDVAVSRMASPRPTR